MALRHEFLGHQFSFRDLRWREEISTSGPRELLAFALHEIDGCPVGPDEARRVLEVFSEPALSRLYTMYGAERGQDREVTADGEPWRPPAPVWHQVAKEPLEDEATDD